MKILVIIPAYNERKNILNVIKGLEKIKLKEHLLDYVVVNDGSNDDTVRLCSDNNINVIDLPFNLGIGGAVQTGYKYAYYNNYDVAIQFDGDGQHDSTYINSLIKEIEKGNNLVIGSRFIKSLSKFKSTRLRRLGIKFLSFLIKLVTGKKVFDPTSGFRAADKNIIRLFANNYPIDYPEPDTVVTVIKKGYKISEIPVNMHERINGKSSINLIKSIYYMIKVSLAIVISASSTKKGDN